MPLAHSLNWVRDRWLGIWGRGLTRAGRRARRMAWNRVEHLERRDLLAAPVLQINSGFSVVSGGTFTITNGQLLTTDTDNTPSQLVYSLQSVPASGTLQLTGINMVVGNLFTQQNINNGSLKYVHNGLVTASDSFDFDVSDGSTLNSTSRVSVGASGGQGTGSSETPAVSADGRYVAFMSASNNLVPDDTNIFSDVFVKDRQTGAIELISRASNGLISNFTSINPVISADGRYVAFQSFAANLVPNDVSSFLDLFVKDRQTGAISRINVDPNGNEANQSQSGFHGPAISSDGRYVTFVSAASNLVPNDTNNAADVFVRDTVLGQTSRVSVTSGGVQVSSGAAFFEKPAISGDGRYVAFLSDANDLVSNDTNIFGDVFVHDRQTGQTTLASLGSGGLSGGNAFYSNVSLSLDGRYVGFTSNSSSLVAGDNNNSDDVFVRDLQSGLTTRVSVSSAGVQGNGSSGGDRPQFSADGRFVLFDSVATNLVSGDTNGGVDLFLRDRQTGETTRVSVDSLGNEALSAYSDGAFIDQNSALSADGRVVVFTSGATTLVSGDTNSATDIFVRDSGVINGTVPITITLAGNTPPTISPIANQSTNEDALTGAIAFTIGDAETAVASLIVSATSSNSVLIAQNGIQIGGSGGNRTLTITPTPNQNGTATITVRVTDLSGAFATSTFNLTVTPVNDPPLLANIGPRALNEGEQLRFIAGATDPDGELVTFTLLNAPTGATIDANTGLFTWIPDSTQGSLLPYNVTVQATDAGGLNDFEVVPITVNDPPTITDLGNQSTPEDTPLGPIDILVGDLETPLNTLFVLGSSSNQVLIPNAKIVVTGTGASRQVTITPNANQSGTSTITLRVFDGLTSTADTFDVTVTPVNDPPTVQGFPQSPNPPQLAQVNVNEDACLLQPFTVADVESGAAAVTVTATSSDQNIVPDANITITGTGSARNLRVCPAADKNGPVTIEVQAGDGTATVIVSTFQLNVVSVNDPPTITAIADQTTLDNTPTTEISFDLADTDSDPATLTLSAITTNPTLVPLANIVFGGSGVTRTVTVTPALNQVGSAVINVLVTDPNGGLALESFVLNVNFQNNQPTITDIGDAIVDANSTVGPLPFTIGDQETIAASLAVSVDISSTNNLARPAVFVTGQGANRNLTLIPPPNVFGTYMVRVIVADANGGTASDTFELTVRSTGLGLSITPLPNSTILEDSRLGPTDFQVTNNAAPGVFTLTASSSNPTLVPAQNVTFGPSSNPGIPALRSLTIQPAANQSGIADITITATGGPDNSSVSTTFRLTVQSVVDLGRFRRSYNPNADFHFFTTSLAEFNAAVLAGYRDETTNNAGFAVVAEAVAGAQTVYRLYNVQRGFHYYTTNAVERDRLVGLVPPTSPDFGRIGWRYERDEGFMYATPVAGTVEIFRLYNPLSGTHLFTESTATRNAVLGLGTWVQHSSLGFAYPIAVGVADLPVIVAARSGAGVAGSRSVMVTAPSVLADSLTTVAVAAPDLSQLGGRLVDERSATVIPSGVRTRTAPESNTPTGSPATNRTPSATAGVDIDVDTLWMQLGPGLTDDIARLWN